MTLIQVSFSVFFALKPVFVITTGKQTTDQGAYTPLDVASYRLQSKGAPVFILGIGKDVDTSELNKIASGPNNVFRVDSFEDLDGNANVIKRGICKSGTVCNIILSFISKMVETITCLSTFHELSLRRCCQVSLRADINPVTVLAFCRQHLVPGQTLLPSPSSHSYSRLHLYILKKLPFK